MSYVHSARTSYWSWMINGLSIAIVAIAIGTVESRGQDNARFQAHLAAGEFGPALAIADQAQDAAARDSMLRGIADAQLRAGARRASLQTAASISGDQSRSGFYDSMANQPFFGGRGGAALADFDTLMNLITSTIMPDSWVDAGGVGAVEPFPGGVFVDARGLLRRMPEEKSSPSPTLASLRRSSAVSRGTRSVYEKSALRKVSLTRLERNAQALWAMGKQPDESMQNLAGLTKIKYLLIYPETRDVVIAGPAEGWTVDPEGRMVGVESRRPVLQLDDLVVVLRNAFSADGRFGCSITPRQENLADVQQFLAESAKRPLKPGQRSDWLDELRSRLGPQDITVTGIDPRTHAAHVLVEADYQMKLVGMGLEPGTLGVTSYLDTIKPAEDGSLPPMDVLRWWFTLNYGSLKTTADRDAFELTGPGVKVLSENELLTERGERVHTRDATNLNRQFANSFTKHFKDLAIKYPIYAELRNVFDLALIAAVIREEDVGGRCDWHQPFFGIQGKYSPKLGSTPKQVESVVNHRVIDRKHFVVGISGGVAVDTKPLVKPAAMKTDTYGLLSADRAGAAPSNNNEKLPLEAWWWD